MSEDGKEHVDTNSVEFKQGVEAGLNSKEDTKNWHAGNELGQELKDEAKRKERLSQGVPKSPSTPVFMRTSPDVIAKNDQDEKDEAEE
jgi:hypothetical protein